MHVKCRCNRKRGATHTHTRTPPWQTKQLAASLRMNADSRAVAFSPEGHTLYSSGSDGKVYLWDVRQRRCRHVFTDDGCIHSTALAVSPDGQYLATGCGMHACMPLHDMDRGLTQRRLQVGLGRR
jgi:WD40 repeat protein